jgi:hypothetical protein
MNHYFIEGTDESGRPVTFECEVYADGKIAVVRKVVR